MLPLEVVRCISTHAELRYVRRVEFNDDLPDPERRWVPVMYRLSSSPLSSLASVAESRGGNWFTKLFVPIPTVPTAPFPSL